MSTYLKSYNIGVKITKGDTNLIFVGILNSKNAHWLNTLMELIQQFINITLNVNGGE